VVTARTTHAGQCRSGPFWVGPAAGSAAPGVAPGVGVLGGGCRFLTAAAQRCLAGSRGAFGILSDRRVGATSHQQDERDHRCGHGSEPTTTSYLLHHYALLRSVCFASALDQ